MKLIGIDFGEKRVGIASTDESGAFALPRAVLPNDDKLVDAVLALCGEQGVERVVLGESKDFKGLPNDIQQKINAFKAMLEDHGIEVVLHPELFTSAEAARLQGAGGMLDASAAALILKSYIDSKSNLT